MSGETTEECQAEADQILEQLSGGVIGNPIVSDESFGFHVEKDGKTLKVWVDRDPEGNGPGHLEIEELV